MGAAYRAVPSGRLKEWEGCALATAIKSKGEVILCMVDATSIRRMLILQDTDSQLLKLPFINVKAYCTYFKPIES